MNKESKKEVSESIETILPFGEQLRPLIVSSYLTKTDLKKLLAQKGIFVSSSEKEITIPLLTKCLLSPNEFEFLRENQRTKEDSIKRTTQVINWQSDVSLIDAIEDNTLPFDKIIPVEVTNYSVLGSPSLIAVQENELMLDYKIERISKTKDWATSKSNHEGKVILKKINDGKQLEISMEYTAIETKDLNSKVVNHLIKQFKGNSYIDKASTISKIKYDDFSNETRIQFLLSFHDEDKLGILEFLEICNIEFGPDNSKKLPDKIEWMQDRVNNLILNGKLLHDVDFLKDPECHNSLIFEQIEAKYKFSYSSIKGNCTISYGFPNYLRTLDKSTEFEIRIVRLNLDQDCAHVAKKEVERKLLSMFAAIKIKKYTKYKIKVSEKNDLKRKVIFKRVKR